jgi:hypothetical protein
MLAGLWFGFEVSSSKESLHGNILFKARHSVKEIFKSVKVSTSLQEGDVPSSWLSACGTL